MVINVWSKNQDVEKLHPDMTVYTIRADFEDYEFTKGLLCDLAWTTKEETKEHHWIKNPLGISKTDILEMSLKKYIELNIKECRGMNSFWDIGRIEFLSNWTQRWGQDGLA